jgi:hypothetical protein
MKVSGLAIILLITMLISCRKDSFISSPDARVNFTIDTVKFDTVFVTAGSTYRNFRVLNENDQKLLLSSITLMGGNSSFFKLNVDGVPGHQFNDVEIAANDSLHLFVQVNIDPSAGTLPFVIRDSIRFSYNGNTRFVQLEAWGQNANFLRDHEVTAPETWNNNLPYVILGPLRVLANQTLTINQGCRIYLHSNAPVIVEGSLVINGLKDTADRVYFQGDRLDEPYNQFPASWPGIFFQPSSRDNVFHYAVIRNAYQAIGLTDPAPGGNPKLVMNECVIDNAYDAGIIALRSSIRARNCLISNCGNNLFLAGGGDYAFEHCTVATIGNRYISHSEPVLIVSNYILQNNNPVAADLDAIFRNCIFWGTNGLVDDEVVVLRSGNTVFNVLFDHNAWKVQAAPSNITANQNINQDPQFDSLATFDNYYDFRLKPFSPIINKGTPSAVNIDLDGNPRPVGLPDPGCFEKQ